MQNTITPIEQFIIDCVRELRLKRNITQKEIAQIIGVSQSFIANIERDGHKAKYNINHVNLIADHFKLSPKVFMPSRAFQNKKLK